jgi:D-aminopeptidase
LPPDKTQEIIGDAARRAVQRVREGESFCIYQPALPVTVEVEFNQSDMADRASLCPGASRGEGKRVSVTTEDMPAAYRVFRTLLALARN